MQTENLKLSPLITESQIQKRIAELANAIDKEFKGEEVIAVCVLKGSFMFYADLIRSLNLDVKCEFFGASSYGDATKSSGQVRITLDLISSVQGKNVVIIEDIVDTGLTMNYLMTSLKARKPKKLVNTALLLKPDALKEPCAVDFVGFEIGNEFVVGYGLDFQGYYRNLPYVARVQNMN
jgi:hypoxanthine phosphoribosyltransferase